jgi:hypothetical protein
VGSTGPASPDIDIAFHNNLVGYRITVSNGLTNLRVIGGVNPAPQTLSVLPNYPREATDASETVQNGTLYIDAVNPMNEAAQLACTLDGQNGLDAGAPPSTACGTGWVPVDFP